MFKLKLFLGLSLIMVSGLTTGLTAEAKWSCPSYLTPWVNRLSSLNELVNQTWESVFQGKIQEHIQLKAFETARLEYQKKFLAQEASLFAADAMPTTLEEKLAFIEVLSDESFSFSPSRLSFKEVIHEDSSLNRSHVLKHLRELDFKSGLTAHQVDRAISELYRVALGERLKSIDQKIDARIAELIQARVTSEGLEKFLKEAQLFRDPTLFDLLRKVVLRKDVQAVLTATLNLSILQFYVPAYLPKYQWVQISERDIKEMLAGSSQVVLNRLIEKNRKWMKVDLFYEAIRSKIGKIFIATAASFLIWTYYQQTVFSDEELKESEKIDQTAFQPWALDSIKNSLHDSTAQKPPPPQAMNLKEKAYENWKKDFILKFGRTPDSTEQKDQRAYLDFVWE